MMYLKQAVIFLIILIGYALSVICVAVVYFSPSLIFDQKSIIYAGAAGLLGSIVYMNRGFYQNIVGRNEQGCNFDFGKWIWWYLSRPILGIVVGVISYLIIYLAFDLEMTVKNQIGFFLLSFLSGYNFHEFVENKICKKINL